jgi:hypothetical protein
MGIGARHRQFLHWWWALPDLRHHPRGVTVDIFSLVVDALGSPAPPPRGPAIDIFYVGGGRSQISITAPREAAIDVLQLSATL